ncbi:MAG: S-methyl-5-thioribose-1-phosphate isomerase [Clostridia bacterium]|nr:S-methyl-5-thioribose-1-phosphate isomerase [Clostridia bacterium]
MNEIKTLPDTVALDDGAHALVIIDQTELPRRLVMLSLTTQPQIFEAIQKLRVRGAPAIGVSAAIGIYLAAREIAAETSDRETFLARFRAAKEYLASSRPTAVNLFWALDRMEDAIPDGGVDEIVRTLHDECLRIRDEDIASCRRIGENGLRMLGGARNILTHCNAGQLAAVRYGTALAPIHLGHERGLKFHVYCDETRPLLQGMRLSAFELSAHGIETTVVCDNMASILMKQGKIDAVIVGADRIAANGDTANKIGTSGVAILAKHYGVPFYVAAPRSTFDANTPTGADIVIEERGAEEIGGLWFREPLAPEGAGAFNPAFDVTDHELITGYITDDV